MIEYSQTEELYSGKTWNTNLTIEISDTSTIRSLLKHKQGAEYKVKITDGRISRILIYIIRISYAGRCLSDYRIYFNHDVYFKKNYEFLLQILGNKTYSHMSELKKSSRHKLEEEIIPVVLNILSSPHIGFGSQYICNETIELLQTIGKEPNYGKSIR